MNKRLLHVYTVTMNVIQLLGKNISRRELFQSIFVLGIFWDLEEWADMSVLH